MVRIIDEQIVDLDKSYIYATGLSTDTKPTGDYINGSIFFAIDSKKVYMYNEANSTWVEV